MRTISGIHLSLVGGISLVTILVAGTVYTTVPSESEIAAVAAEAGLPSLTPTFVNKVDRLVRPIDSAHLETVFDNLGYQLTAVRDGAAVPRVYVTTLPTDLADLSSVDQRKALFLRSVLPLILMSNRELANDRAQLQDLAAQLARGEPLSPGAVAWLDQLRARHGMKPDADFDQLLLRVDEIPPSLALAQAIEESGWGTSRFARDGNALYGQRVWTDASGGLVPKKRAQGQGYRVGSYQSLMGGVRAYMHNLNSHAAYDEFRAERARHRAQGKSLGGAALAATLLSYSERGANYVKQLGGLIRSNKLTQLDKAQLTNPGSGPQLAGGS